MSRILKHDGGTNGSRKKSLTVLVSLMLILLIGVGGTLAYLVTKTDDVKNTFTPSEVKTSIDEKIEGGVKKDVVIKNDDASVKAYIRASVIVNWINDDGDVYAKAPVAGTDYSIAFGNSWTKSGDYYYHNGAVEPGESTAKLITEANYLGNAPEGYYLSIEIISQAVQADGVGADNKTPVELAWGSTAAGLVGATN